MEFPLLDPLTDAYAILCDASADRDAARGMTLDLLTARVAAARGLLPPDTVEALAGLPLRLAPADAFSGPGRAAVTEAAAVFGAMRDEAFSPYVPGECYPLLLEIDPGRLLVARKKELRRLRRQQGIFYTPPLVLDRVCAMVLPHRPDGGTVLDPAMGAGHFLLAAAERLAGGDRSRARRLVATRLYGVDKDPVAVRLARRALWLAFSDPGDVCEPPEAHFRHGDALLGPDFRASVPPSMRRREEGLDWREAFPGVAEADGFDVVLGNPPYDVLTNFGRRPEAKAYAAALRESGAYRLALRGQINLYRCFIERGLALTRPGGWLSYVVPSGLLLDRVAAPLRRALLEKHAADRFEIFPEQGGPFAGVTQAVAIFRARREAGAAERLILVDGDRVHETTLKVVRGLSEEMPLPPATEEDWRLLDFFAERAPRRFDTIAEGFVGEVDQTVFRKHMADTPAGALLVRGSHLAPFHVDLRPTPGRERFLDKAGFLKQKGRAAGACLRRVGGERTAQLGIRNLATRPRLVAATVPPGVFLGNSVNFWLPRGEGTVALLTGLLNSRLYDWRFRLTSGNNNINVCEIEALPLPAKLAGDGVRAVEKAVKACARLAAQGRPLDAARARLDAAVYDLFGLPGPLRAYLDRAEEPSG